jgi:TetR/AcrR family transcriptional regulator, transcriptional repressor for nem operon
MGSQVPGGIMRVSREQVAINRRQILDAASRLFRERGFDAVTVAEVMGAAGLTHGGFYGYFDSKDALIAATLEHIVSEKKETAIDLARRVGRYLAPSHRDDVADGCVYAALGAEVVRQTPEARAALADALPEIFDHISGAMEECNRGDSRKRAIACWSAMVGALILSRIANDKKLSTEILSETRKWIVESIADGK